MDNFDKKYLSIGEAAKYLGLSATTLRRWHDGGSFTATFISPGGHRYYSVADLEKKTKGLFKLAEDWVGVLEPSLPSGDFYCSSSDRFKARNEKMALLLENHPLLAAIGPLVSSMSGEIGNNSFDHNLGNWPDVPGVFFAYDLGKRIVVLADRGLGVLTTLRSVKPSLETDAEALQTAFSEYITARAPQHRGNGLKYVVDALVLAKADLFFQSGNAVLTTTIGKDGFMIKTAPQSLRGCLAFIKF